MEDRTRNTLTRGHRAGAGIAPARIPGAWRIAFAGLLFLSGCSRRAPEPASAGSPQSSAAPAQAQAQAQTQAQAQATPQAVDPLFSFTNSLPHVGGVAGYVGSHTCQECHAKEYDTWHRSYHRTMTQLAAPDAIQADFNNVSLTENGTRFTLSRTNDAFWVRMERDVAPGAEVPLASSFDVRLGLVTGSHHMQVFWVPSGRGNVQVGFPFTWLIPEHRWVPRNDTFIRPENAPHGSEVWNLVCCRCHTTGLEPHVNSAAHSADTRAAELGIACEACHGPGQRHAQARRRDRANSNPDPQQIAAEIIQPRKISPIRAGQICGFCHSMKWFDQAENWRETGFRYRPGDDLEATTPIIRPSRVDQIPGLAQYLSRNPDLLRDFFWPDGMIRVSGRDYNGLIESPCYKGGEFSCLSCHSLHKFHDPDGQLAWNRSGKSACTQCHKEFNDSARLLQHTRHAPESSGSECYNCHMPHTAYGVLKAIRSHQISSPKISDQLATGRPNACNLCHLDKSLAWSADQLEAWFRQPKPLLSPTQTNTAESVRLALSGDAGQRALIAWHLGWQPALEASGRDWIPAVLAQLLDDPSAAVRCIAARSFRAASGLALQGYDFTTSPAERTPVRGMVWQQWSERLPAGSKNTWPPQTRVDGANPTQMQQAFDQLASERNDRPVRLRE